MTTQATTLLVHLIRRPMTTGTIRAACGISSVGAVVHSLRNAGIDIWTELVPVRTRHGRASAARYHLHPKAVPRARRFLRREA